MIGKDVKVLRLLHKVKTQKQLAAMLGVTERTISSLEVSAMPVNPNMMRELRAWFNVDKYEEIKNEFSDLSNI